MKPINVVNCTSVAGKRKKNRLNFITCAHPSTQTERMWPGGGFQMDFLLMLVWNNCLRNYISLSLKFRWVLFGTVKIRFEIKCMSAKENLSQLISNHIANSMYRLPWYKNILIFFSMLMPYGRDFFLYKNFKAAIFYGFKIFQNRFQTRSYPKNIGVGGLWVSVRQYTSNIDFGFFLFRSKPHYSAEELPILSKQSSFFLPFAKTFILLDITSVLWVNALETNFLQS